MNKLKLTFINVGYGEATLIQLFSEQPSPALPAMPFTVLIDGGSGEDAEYAPGNGRTRCADYLREHNIKKLDLLINTHIHEDHTSGLVQVVNEIPVSAYWGCVLHDARTPLLKSELASSVSTEKFLRALNDSRFIQAKLRAANVPLFAPRRQERAVALAAGLTATLLGPTTARAAAFEENLLALYAPGALVEKQSLLRTLDAGMNNASIVFHLNYQNRRILLPGDTNHEGYAGLTKSDLAADVFKLGHHGQLDSLSEELLRAIDPRIAVISAASDRRYESIHPAVLASMQAYALERNTPLTVLYTDVPDLPPYTNGIAPHRAAVVEVAEDGTLSYSYET